MIVSDARRVANQRNAQKSTGPKTEPGKEASRQTARTHGLTALTVGQDEAEVVRERALAFCAGSESGSAWVSWVATEAATITLQLDRLAVTEREQRDLAALRAATVWDDDRRAAVARVGERLARHPGRTVAELRQTPHGCDWLIERWTAVADLATRFFLAPTGPRTWEQRQWADLLLGKSVEAHDATSSAEVPDPWYGSPAAVRVDADRARTAIAELQAQRLRVAPVDAALRQLTEAGLADDSVPELRRLRRYAAALHKRLLWCHDQARSVDRPTAPVEVAEPSSVPAVSPADSVSSPVEPGPTSATDSEVARIAPAPATPATPPISSRVANQLRQAEARRSSKRRKLDRRRA